jgi:hypothetical protein
VNAPHLSTWRMNPHLTAYRILVLLPKLLHSRSRLCFVSPWAQRSILSSRNTQYSHVLAETCCTVVIKHCGGSRLYCVCCQPVESRGHQWTRHPAVSTFGIVQIIRNVCAVTPKLRCVETKLWVAAATGILRICCGGKSVS